MRTQHTQRQRDDEEDDAFQDGVLKDGARYTVPLRLMDSWQRDVAQHFDTDGRYPHTPGFIVRDGVIRTCLDDCYDAYDERISQQYKGQLECVADGHDVDTRAGDSGKYVRRKPKKVQKRDPQGREAGTEELDDRNTIKNATYAAYDSDLAAAWRRAK